MKTRIVQTMKTLVLFTACLTSAAMAQQGPARCGDCWCAGAQGNTCPPYELGLCHDVPQNIFDTFASLSLTSPPITLQAADGSSDCYPFAESVGPIDNYPRSQDPQCQLPTSDGAAVCAYKYAVSEEESCAGSDYEIVNYDSVEAATADGAVPVHSGACGVCSNAADLALRMRTLDNFAATVTLCAVTYSLSSSADRFDTLVACHTNPEVLGLSEECALLWAHYSAVNSVRCPTECAANANPAQPYNGDPPTCELLDCLSCSKNLFQAEQDALAGFVPTRAGLVEGEAFWPCEDYSLYAAHVPCSGELLSCAIDDTMTTGPPTEAPTPTSAVTYRALWYLVAVTMCIIHSLNQ